MHMYMQEYSIGCCHIFLISLYFSGVHSGDATLVLPAQDLNKETVQKITQITESIASALSVSGTLMPCDSASLIGQSPCRSI